MRPSPQPTASRLFTVLLTVLLISSLVAPFAAGPAVADDGDDGDDEPGCLYEQIGIPWFQCELDDPVEVTSDETMIHTMASLGGVAKHVAVGQFRRGDRRIKDSVR